jgi:hypothetical protein
MLLAGSVGRKGLQEQMHGLNSKQKEHRETQQCRHEGCAYYLQFFIVLEEMIILPSKTRRIFQTVFFSISFTFANMAGGLFEIHVM